MILQVHHVVFAGGGDDGWSSPGTIADVAVALFTAALAGMTGWLAWQTRDAVGEATKATQAAVDEAAATQTLVSQGAENSRFGRLPLVVPNLERISVSVIHQQSGPRVDLSVPIFNYGAGVALGLQLNVTMLDQRGEREAVIAATGAGVGITALSGNSSDAINLALEGVGTDSLYPFRGEIRYADLQGDNHRAAFRYLSDKGGGDSLKIERLDSTGSAVETLLSIFEPTD